VTAGEQTVSAPTSADAAKVDALTNKVRELEASLGRAAAMVGKLETQLGHARAQVAWFQRTLFGQKRERVDTALLRAAWREFLEQQEAAARGDTQPLPQASNAMQLLLMLGTPSNSGSPITTAEAALDAAGVPAGEAPPSAPEPKAKPKRDPHGRKKLPSDLRTEKVVLNPDLIADGTVKDVEVSYRIGIRPAEVYAIEIHRPRIAIELASGKTRYDSAPPPSEMIDRGLFAPSALAHILALKWERHVPFARIALFFARHGYHLSKSTLSGVSLRAEPLARRLVDAMIAHAKKVAPYLAIDATGAKVQAADRCTNGHTWMRFVEDIGVFVSFSAKHDALAANHLLDGWDCPFLADGAAVFNDFERTGAKRFGCYSHARRKFFYAIASDPRALVGVRLVNDLFENERALISVGASKRLEGRRERSAPILERLLTWCRETLGTEDVGTRGLLAKACRYTLNQEPRLRRFLENGRVPIHNNLVELQIRHFAVGRKNWLFYGSENAAAAGSTWLTLVLSARMHGLHVETYFRELFRVLPSWPQTRLLELAPHAWAGTRSRIDPVQLAAEYGPLQIPPPPALGAK
jgi:transposase